MTEPNVAAGADPAQGKDANLVYILYLVGLIVGVTSLVGVIMAYINRGEAPEWVKTHFTYQIRTFWIGLLYGFIGVVTIWILIGFLILLFVAVWWIIRCVKGMKAIERGEPVANPATWMW
jgi:uncharacterized membrane protein